MRDYIFILIFLFFVGLYSCKKESDEYPSTYAAYTISDYRINVYSKDGDITTPELVAKNQSKRNYESDSNKENVFRESISEVTYFSENEAKLTFESEKEDKLRRVKKSGGITFFEKQEISEHPAYGYGHGDFIFDWNKMKPLFYEVVDVPVEPGYMKVVKAKHCFFAIEKNEELIFPIYEIEGRFYDDTDLNGNYFPRYSFLTIFPSNNEFDGSKVELNDYNDTLVVFQYNIKMKKISW
ncbi:hypothetical protein [Sunxiuqinia elliptica]|uniref:Lipoprotein n=1 Tax=Sunxiuqinia elliptica TaxID=655355 RepID=A0A4R6GQN7_9BACT|nr:hypothetical protein [Sunxiuqinia elliptica]TDN97599.1 hypothetical protein DET52_1091 [Sunxiuqinia elliptica]TDO66955.1 hypothetical protein DET65_0322 [Sunxiuqinia elliptica]